MLETWSLLQTHLILEEAGYGLILPLLIIFDGLDLKLGDIFSTYH